MANFRQQQKLSGLFLVPFKKHMKKIFFIYIFDKTVPTVLLFNPNQTPFFCLK